MQVVPRPPDRIISSRWRSTANAGHGRSEAGAGEAFPAPLRPSARLLGTGTMAVPAVPEVPAVDAHDDHGNDGSLLRLNAVPRELSAEVLERTTRMERSSTYAEPVPLPPLPAPLPPLPAPNPGADPWMAPGQVNAGAIPDLGALAGDSGSVSAGYQTGHQTAPPSRSSSRISGRISGRISEAAIAAALASSRPAAQPQAQAYPWAFSLLLGATCLTVGMVLGALIFGNF